MSILEAFLAGKEARRTADAAEQINAMQQFIGQNGKAIMGGDANALGQLAGFGQQGLQMAMGIQGDTQARERQAAADAAAADDRAYGRAQDEKANGRADQEWSIQLEEYAAGKTAEERATEAARIEEGVKGALMTDSPEAWDAYVKQNGMPDLVGRFDQKDSIAAQFMSVAEVLKANAPAEPLSPEGKLATDISKGILPDGTAATPDTVINMGEGDTFYKELDKSAAAMFDSLMTDGIQAGRTLGLVDRLDAMLKETPTGGSAALTRLAGEVGIDVGGLGEVQAIQALINQIVPQQRQPGSGPMSDADLALFKSSVPRLINTAEGNAMIVDTMRGINSYVMDQAAIADAVANREITPAEGRKRLKALANPLDGFTGGGAAPPPPPAGVDPADWAEMTPEERAVFK